MVVVRKLVLLILCIAVVAPVVPYAHRIGTLKSASSRSEYTEEVSAFKSNGYSRHLHALSQESLALKEEPVGVVYSENLNQDVNQKEHKSAPVLSAAIDEIEFQRENPSTQVTDVAWEEDQIEMSGHVLADDAIRNVDISFEDQTGNSSDGEESEEWNVPVAPPDARVRQIKDQLIRAKVYLSLLPANRNNDHFIRELQQRIKEVERVLGEATIDSELPESSYDKFKAMEQTLKKGKQIHDDCASIVKKLRAMLHSTEVQVRAHRKQTLFLTQLNAKTIPKELNCLPLRLTSEYYALNSYEQQFPGQEKLDDPSLFHYALFSDNVLAAAVVVNSTITHAKEPEKHVFHIVTDRLNYAAMRMWFLVNPPGKASIQVQNIEEFIWFNASYSPVLKQLGSPSMKEYYFRTHQAKSDPPNLKFRNPKYLSVLNHLRFYLPEVFPELDKVLLLDDDVVVQKDLTELWSLNLNGNVISVVETCGGSFHHFDQYLNFSHPMIAKNFNPQACGWAFGMNIFDLNEWRRQNITEIYHKWQELNRDRHLWELGTLPPGLITLWKRTFSLDRSWHVVGLGYNPDISQEEIEQGAVIHYSGNLKPWLETGIPEYRNYWAKYVDYDHVYLRECNISP